MGFNWVYVNPFHAAGTSGGLHAIRDTDRLHPVVQGSSSDASDRLLRRFVDAARGHGLGVMADLVLDRTSRDSVLAREHPDWIVRDGAGRVSAGRVAAALDPRGAAARRDSAAIAWDVPKARPALIAHASTLVRRYLDAGIRGFHCDTAARVPAAVWRKLLDEARGHAPGTLFAADTLGAAVPELSALALAGFDALFNNARWWDFRRPWLLEQYETLRHIAPTIAFPEAGGGERLAAEMPGADAGTLERLYRQRAVFAAAFSSGMMIPMGFEYGMSKRLDATDTRPGDWEWALAHRAFDLTGFLAELNAARTSIPALNTEGPQRRVTAPHGRVVGLLRLDGGDESVAAGATLLLVNPSHQPADGVDPGPLLAACGGRFPAFRDRTPDAAPIPFEPGVPVALGALEARLFAAEAEASHSIRLPAAEDAKHRKVLAAARVAIEDVYPEIGGGRFAAKRIVGDPFKVWADIFSGGHGEIAAQTLWREPGARAWRIAPMRRHDNDRWVGGFPLRRPGRYRYTLEAWSDSYATVCADIAAKTEASQTVSVELAEARALIDSAAATAKGEDHERVAGLLARLDAAPGDAARFALVLSVEARTCMAAAGPRTGLTRYEKTLELVVDRTRARFSAWYEMFPRSQSGDGVRHGTFDDVAARLPYVRSLGFDVLYFPPIHPIGKTARKGRNNSVEAGPDDPGSPWAVGSAEGGHDALHPELGTFEDFRRLVAAAHDHGLEIALDFAVQCSRDHPWLKEHPEWFEHRPDGSIKFAENPPKKYEDIVNPSFDGDAFPVAWIALRDIVLFWLDQGVRIFRVDNPHTKPLGFWEWLIRDVQDRDPEVIFLSEAFTSPKMMKRLAKVGFSQSYTYFTWRHTKAELTEYLSELIETEVREFYRPNFFVNTPDINPPILQGGNPAAFRMRALLAATLSASWGVYNGFELCEGTPIPGREEYLDSEKYQLRAWDWDRPGNIRDFIALLNGIRRDNPALQETLNLRFAEAWDDNILAYWKMTESRDNVLLVAVNLDPDHAHGADFEVPLWRLGLPDGAAVEIEDLLSGARQRWLGKIQHIWLDPQITPGAVWRIVPPGFGPGV